MLLLQAFLPAEKVLPAGVVQPSKEQDAKRNLEQAKQDPGPWHGRCECRCAHPGSAAQQNRKCNADESIETMHAAVDCIYNARVKTRGNPFLQCCGRLHAHVENYHGPSKLERAQSHNGAAGAPEQRPERSRVFKDGHTLRGLTLFVFAIVFSPVFAEEPGKCVTGDCKDGAGTAVWESGDTYTGGFRSGQMSGRGTFKTAGGRVFEGNFQDGQANGQFRVTYPDGTVFTGELRQGERAGKGVQRSAKGTYTGDFAADNMNGRGVFDFVQGDRYEGEFKNGLFHGEGAISYKGGLKYTGSFVQGRLEGKGKILFADGREYEGEVRDGKMFGQGRLTLADRSVFEGTFTQGRADGEGVLTLRNGDVYRGTFQAGRLEGNGVFESKSGTRYEGPFLAGQPHGKGELVTPRMKYTGEFARGQMTGEAEIVYKSGARYVGSVVNGKKEGQGEWTRQDGTVVKGLFKNDNPVSTEKSEKPEKSPGETPGGIPEKNPQINTDTKPGASDKVPGEPNGR